MPFMAWTEFGSLTKRRFNVLFYWLKPIESTLKRAEKSILD